MKTFLIILALALAGFGVFAVTELGKPEILARIEVTKAEIVITNGNDKPWNGAEIILNDAFAGPVLTVPGQWPAGEERRLPLNQFAGRLNKQAFNPEFQRVEKVIITAPGFSLASRQH